MTIPLLYSHGAVKCQIDSELIFAQVKSPGLLNNY